MAARRPPFFIGPTTQPGEVEPLTKPALTRLSYQGRDMNRGRKQWVVVAVAALLSSTAARLYAAEGSFDRTLKVSGTVDLDVTTGSGNISVRQGGAGTVHVVGHIKAHDRWDSRDAESRVRALEANPPIEQNGNMVRIGQSRDSELLRNVSISYEVEVPADTRLHAQTGSGNETITGISGPLHLNTGSGNITASGGSEVRANTGSGDIRLESINGSLYANTGSGNVHVEQSSLTDVKINTGSGNVIAGGVRGLLKVMTGSGDIRVEGTQTGEWKLEAGSGTINVRLPADAAFDFYAHTGSGHIDSQHPITMTGSLSRHELRGPVRGGGPLLQARTGSGNINIQ
jgi:putative adhesin